MADWIANIADFSAISRFAPRSVIDDVSEVVNIAVYLFQSVEELKNI
jgi:hypothetical protein